MDFNLLSSLSSKEIEEYVRLEYPDLKEWEIKYRVEELKDHIEIYKCPK